MMTVMMMMMMVVMIIVDDKNTRVKMSKVLSCTRKKHFVAKFAWNFIFIQKNAKMNKILLA
jgi:hypothetical protein